MNSEDDPELQDLLRQLDEESTEAVEEEAEPEPDAPQEEVVEPEAVEAPLDPEVVSGDPSPQLEPGDPTPPPPLHRELPAVITGDEVADEQAGPAVDVRSMVARYEAAVGELMAHCRGDRAGLQELIDRLTTALTEAGVSNVQRVVLEALVKAHEVKANVVNNMTKILETGAKYLAATKGGAQVNVGVVNGATIEDKSLEALLSEPTNPNEDFDG